MSEDSKPTEKAEITPTEAEERVSTAVSEVVPEEPNGLLIEEDGDPFWVIQRVFWGFLKTGALLGILLLLIWLVWRPGAIFGGGNQEPEFVIEAVPEKVEPINLDSEPTSTDEGPGFWSRLFGRSDEKVTPEVGTDGSKTTPNTTQTPEPTTTTTTVTAPVRSDDPTGAAVAYELETQRTQLVRGILPQTVNWLRRAKTIGEVSLAVVRQESPTVRSRQVEDILAESDQLFVDSANLQIQLQAELDYFLQEGQAANARTAEIEEQISLTLQALDPVSLEGLVNQKISSQQQASYFLSQAKIRDTLLKNVRTFDALLRQQSIPLLNPATELRAS